jgi:glycosyltransferase involved in cell wall biosynthesis
MSRANDYHWTTFRQPFRKMSNRGGQAPFVVYVKGGPTYDLGNNLMHHAALVSRLGPGLFLSHGPAALASRTGDVDLVNLELPDIGRTHLQRARVLWRTVWTGVRAIRRSGREGLVVGYDPFENGIVAWAIALLSRSRFICEVNGAYANPDNLADFDPPDARERKRRTMVRVGSFVLRRADGIRLLYDAQLEGLDVDVRRKIVRRCIDPVPLERFSARGDEPFVLLVGYPFRRKGVDVLLKAFARIRDRHPDWRVVLIGHDLQRALANCDLPRERVEAVKPMGNQAIADWIGRAGIVVLPSRSEAMGRVLLEAAAAERPRVAADVDGIHTVVAHESDGLLFAKEDDAGLASHLDRLMSSSAERRRFGLAARERVLRDFSDERYVAFFADFTRAVMRR